LAALLGSLALAGLSIAWHAGALALKGSGVLLGMLCAVYGLRCWLASRKPFYLQPTDEVIDVWDILPGEGIGPIPLGPPGPGVIAVLRQATVYLCHDAYVTCVVRHPHGWTAVVARTSAPSRHDAPPDPMAFETIETICTSCPAHGAPGGLRVGSTLPEAASALGMPDQIARPHRPGVSVLRYRDGIELGVRRNRIRWIRVYRPRQDCYPRSRF
jgi:hypothetical protein